MHRKVRRLFTLTLLTSATFAASSARAQTAYVYPEDAWKYDASAQDLGTAWRGLAFDDSSWQSGEPVFGYGPGLNPETKIETPATTVYLRKTFDVTDAADVDALTFEVAFAQGLVVYLNGQEVLRQAMPAGAVSYGTPATGHASTGLETFDLAAATSNLVSGKNSLAVEVHQTSPAANASYFWGWLHYGTKSTRVVRGPYLQLVTPTSAVVRWRTNHPTDSRVAFGASAAASNVDVAALTTEHEVTLTGLEASTSYVYSVGTTAKELAADPGQVFRTAPTLGNTTPVRVWVLGDSGSQDSVAQEVRDGYYQLTQNAQPDLWLMLGDNGYPDGTDLNYQYGIFEHMYEAALRASPLWPTFGNHDWGGDGSGQNPINDAEKGSGPYFDMHTLPKAGEAGGEASGTEGYYSFDWGDVHFVSLESIQLKTPQQIAWLEADLAKTKAKWLIGYFHVPPYTKGSHDSDEPGHEFVRQGLAKTLEAYGVDLVLAGHSHVYERSMLIDGHYQTSDEFEANPSAFTRNAGDGREDGDGAYVKPAVRAPHQGAVYVVAGKSGDRPGGGSLDHPVMVELEDPLTKTKHRGLDIPGSLDLSVNGERLDARYVDSNGQVLDHFTISKGGGGTSGSGGQSGAGGGSGSGGSPAKPDESDDGGCGCRSVPGSGAGHTAWFAVALGWAWARRRARPSA